ncbi:MAG TPA: hypothetical protein VEQ85_07605, partial [Lacipirellulaceae bacterium]|nr:hypothetical protein [Lacipirellulaceae bacterium]
MAIKYAAQVQGVQEVSLRGEADLQPWSAELAALGLTPIVEAGRVGAMLSATSARFRGVRVREFSIALLARENDTGREGWYLAHAFNSLRLFAWIERTMFS